MNRKLLFVILGLALVALFSSCSSPGGTPSPSPGEENPPANTVYAYDSFFKPTSLTVSVGTAVTWVNKGAVVHTVTSGVRNNPDGKFNSGDMRSGASFAFTFQAAGEYKYYCIYHTGMDGTIIVQ